MQCGFTSVSKITRNKSKLISLSYGVSNNGYVNRLNQQAVVIKLYKDKKYVQIPTGIRGFNDENISIHTLSIIKKLLLQYEFALYEYYEANNYPNLSLKDAKLTITILIFAVLNFKLHENNGKSYFILKLLGWGRKIHIHCQYCESPA